MLSIYKVPLYVYNLECTYVCLVPRKYLPGVVERERIGILLTLVQLCSGCIATALAVWR